MPQLKFLKSIMVIATGAFFGFYAVQFFMPHMPNQNRFLASATMSKLGSDQLAKSVFDLKIKNEVVASSVNDVSVVKVTIEAFQNIPSGLTYKWILPEGAEVVDGTVSGAFPELTTNQLQEMTIKLKGYSHDIKNHVVFEVKGDVNHSLIDQNVIVSSRPEDSFEYVVQQREQASVGTQSKNKLGAPKSKSAIDPKNVVF